ncbi:TPA: fimbria/pilus outer membrane usher protein [Klebsiella aerogenes]|nr:fimbria/pilus outer membrane usher protein [Klebsiella aerogenes]
MYLTLSLPWGNTGTLSYNATMGQGNDSHQLSYYDRLGDRDYYQISGGMTRSGTTGSGYWNHDGDYARSNLNASYEAGGYSALSLSLQGGMVATAKGAALHRGGTQGGTRMLLDTGVEGIPVKGYGSSVRTNVFGNAVVPDVSSYYRNRLSIDLDTLPDNAEATQTVVQGTLTEGAIGYRQFDVVSGARAMATVRLAGGTAAPFGASVQNAKGQNTGIIGDDGSVYLSGMQPGAMMQVSWGDGERCVISLPTHLPEGIDHGLLLPCQPARSGVVNPIK